MGRVLAWSLALLLLLSGCAQTEETMEPGISSSAEESSSGVLAELPPEVTGPDADGFFPAISDEDFDRWVTYGAPDAERPAGAITPFLETESCQKYLADRLDELGETPGDLGELSDWYVLFEDDHYILHTGMYDPYTYSWRDQWMPYRFVVLGRDAPESYDRLALVCIDQYVVNAGGDGLCHPRAESLIYCGYGRESALRFGTEQDYAGARAVFRYENDYYPSLVNSGTGRTLLIDFSVTNGMIAVRGIPEGFGHTIFVAETLKTYKMNGDPDDRIVYLFRDNDLDGHIDIAYYDASSEELHPLARGGGRYGSPQFSVLSAGCFAIVSGEADELSLYHTESETPWAPAAVLGGNGSGLSDGGVYLLWGQPLTDKKDSGLHVLPYINLEEQILCFCTFGDDGAVAENLSSGLYASEDGWYLDFQNFNDGIAYFLYYADGGAYGGTHLAMNLRTGKSHALQIWKTESPALCTAEGGLNLRSGPGAEYEKLAVIPERAEVILLREADGWSYVVYGETVGWASSEYLETGGHD